MGNYRHHGYPTHQFFWGEDRGFLTLLNREWPEAGEFLMLQACNLSDFVLNHPRFKPGKVSTDISPKSRSIVFFETYINIWTQLVTREPQLVSTAELPVTWPHQAKYGPRPAHPMWKAQFLGFFSFDFQDEHFQKVFHAFFNHIWVSK